MPKAASTTVWLWSRPVAFFIMFWCSHWGFNRIYLSRRPGRSQPAATRASGKKSGKSGNTLSLGRKIEETHVEIPRSVEPGRGLQEKSVSRCSRHVHSPPGAGKPLFPGFLISFIITQGLFGLFGRPREAVQEWFSPFAARMIPVSMAAPPRIFAVVRVSPKSSQARNVAPRGSPKRATATRPALTCLRAQL